jgi:hypothetical protein
MMMESALFIMWHMFVMGGLKPIKFTTSTNLGVFSLMIMLP